MGCAMNSIPHAYRSWGMCNFLLFEFCRHILDKKTIDFEAGVVRVEYYG